MLVIAEAYVYDVTTPIRPPSCRARGGAVLARGAGILAGALMLSRVVRTFGSRSADRAANLAGDELVPIAPIRGDHAIDIDATPSEVWPWLVQLGVDRGGFYTFVAIERALGMDVSNADVIRPEWQNLAVGDTVWLADGLGLGVAHCDPSRVLVLSPHAAGAITTGAMGFDFSWAFHLTARGSGSRLYTRERYRPRTAAGVLWALVGVHGSGLMTAGMLRGIRRRAER